MPIGALIATIAGGLFGNKKNGKGGLFQRLFKKTPAQKKKKAARKAARKARRAKGEGLFARLFGGGADNQPDTLLGALQPDLPNKKDRQAKRAGEAIMAFIEKNGLIIIIGFAGFLGVRWLLTSGMLKKKVGRRKKRSKPGAATSSSSGKSRQSVITTKGGKVIRGADNVAAYKKRIRNLKKAQAARK